MNEFRIVPSIGADGIYYRIQEKDIEKRWFRRKVVWWHYAGGFRSVKDAVKYIQEYRGKDAYIHTWSPE